MLALDFVFIISSLCLSKVIVYLAGDIFAIKHFISAQRNMRSYAAVDVADIAVFHSDKHIFAGYLHDRTDGVTYISHTAGAAAALLTEQQYLGVKRVERAGQ